MENYKKNRFRYFLIAFMGISVLNGCDEKLEPEPMLMDLNESLLVREWKYEYILMDGDTIRNLFYSGEPVLGDELDTPIGLRYLIYKEDHSYELRATNINYLGFGDGESYQPNFGFWDLEGSGSALTLIHNKTIGYEVRYELLQLTGEIMVRKQIGDRPTLLILDFHTLETKEITVSSWIEVFVPLPD